MKPGSLVRYRERDWVVLPSEDPQQLRLRPLGGGVKESCSVWLPLSHTIAYSFPFERVTESQFPLPTPETVQDHTAVRLMQQAARLLLREGAAPLRSLGQISARPRPYQYVPLLMALRLNPVRLLIADDVGIGKSLEAILIARELLARGEIRRIAVLCPPYLCDHWQRELAEKAQLDAVVMRSGTMARWERLCPTDRSVFQQFRHFIASIDLVKGERYRAAFLLHCPEFVIVDEAHGAACPPGDTAAHSQQQRHNLVRAVAACPSRHLVLLTATPHSGIEQSFLSLLELLRPEFAHLNLAGLSEQDRDELAKHFIQRRRVDVQKWLGQDTPFPERDPWPPSSGELPYTFSAEYRHFYEEVFNFARGLIEDADKLTGRRRRMQYWSALALMRCVSSSPAAAAVSLERRLGVSEDTAGDDELALLSDEELKAAYEPFLYDSTEIEAIGDAGPHAVLATQEKDPSWTETDRRRLREFARRAEQLRGAADTKLQALCQAVGACLKDGYHPIVWCRYIATSDYVAQHLQEVLGAQFSDLRIASITGAMREEERQLKLQDLAKAARRVLVATDCLSEGINLQEHYSAVIHYDLPWNPNRLEQREGRVDRFGQPSAKVRTILIYGKDNPVDGAVLEVLIRKAKEIHRDLGVSLPVPMESETVMETVLKSIFARTYSGEQLVLFDSQDEAAVQAVKQFYNLWDNAARREKQTRTRFAQRRLKPEEVQRELEETDAVLGDPAAVQRFVQEASQRLNFVFRRSAAFRNYEPPVWEIDSVPQVLQQALPSPIDWPWKITFDAPAPPGVTYVGRNHPFVEKLAEYILDQAFYPSAPDLPVARCGAIRTTAVSHLTTLLLLRVRYLIYKPESAAPSFAEETLVWGYAGLWPDAKPLSLSDARQLMDEAAPTANLEPALKREYVRQALAEWDNLQHWPPFADMLQERASRLRAAHQRLRAAVSPPLIRIEPQKPPDLLGVLILVPQPAIKPINKEGV